MWYPLDSRYTICAEIVFLCDMYILIFFFIFNIRTVYVLAISSICSKTLILEESIWNSKFPLCEVIISIINLLCVRACKQNI